MKNEIQNLENKKSDVEKKLNSLRGELGKIKPELNQLSDELGDLLLTGDNPEKLSDKVARLSAREMALTNAISKQETELQLTEKQLKQAIYSQTVQEVENMANEEFQVFGDMLRTMQKFCELGEKLDSLSGAIEFRKQEFRINTPHEFAGSGWAKVGQNWLAGVRNSSNMKEFYKQILG